MKTLLKILLISFLGIHSLWAQTPQTDVFMTGKANEIIGALPGENTALRIGNNFKYLIDSKVNVNQYAFVTVTGTTNYVGTITPAISTYTKLRVFVTFGFTNAGAPTINLGLGVKNIVNEDGTTPANGAIPVGVKLLAYNGTSFQIVGGGGSAFTLTNGQGTTANSTAVDLGGTISTLKTIDFGTTGLIVESAPSGGATSTLASFTNQSANPTIAFSTANGALGSLNYLSSATLSSSSTSSMVRFRAYNSTGSGAQQLILTNSGVQLDVSSGNDATGDTYYRKSDNTLGRLAAVAPGSIFSSAGVTTPPAWVALPSVNGDAVVTNGTALVSYGLHLDPSFPTSGRITVGIWNASFITAPYGGTGFTSYAVGDILRATTTTALGKLPLGTALQVLRVNAGATDIEWAAAAGGGTPGGSNTQVQFNNSGAFGGNANFTINNGTGVVTFGQLPTIPLTPSATTDAASKGYVDAQALGPFSTTAQGYTNLSGNSLAILKGGNTWLAPGTALQVLRVNAGATNLEWATISAGGMSNPMTTLGDFIYEDASPAPARLAGNITTTKKFIAQTGNGSISAVPAWSTIVVGDIPLLSGFANGTTPVSTDKIVGVQSGANVYWNLSQFAGYNLITAAGSSLTQRQTIDVYNGLTAADNVTKTDLVLGGPLTVNTTISGPFKLIMNNNLAGALTLNGTWTAAGVTENHVDIIPTITARATASDVIRAVNIAPSLTSAAATQTLTALLVNPTFTDVNSATKYLLRVQNNTTDAFTIQHNGTQNFQASYNSNGGSTTNVSQLFGGTVTYLASSDAAYISLIAPTYNVNSQGGTKAYGYFYNPTITNGTLATHYAFYATSGDLLLATGNETISAGQLTIANGQSQAATFTGKVLVTGNFTTGSAANNILSVQNTNTALYSTVSFDNTGNNAIYYSGSTWNPSGTLLAASAMWVTVTGGGGIIFRSDGNGDIVTAIGGAATTKEVMRLKAGGAAIHTQQINTSGSPVAFKLVGGANTTLTASAESSDFYLNLARTVQFSTGALSLQRAAKIEGPTYGFVGASTLTDAATFSVINPPLGGTNATITNSHGILISSASLTNATNSYGLTVNTSTGATNNYAIQTIGGTSLFAAGTTSYAPFKLQSGSLLTTAQAFAVEANANSFYQTKNSTLRYGQGGVIFDNIADANNGTTVETDLYTYTTPANTLAEDGDKIVGSYVGTFNDATATVQLKVYFAGTAIGDTGVLTISVTGGWTADCRVIRTSSTTARTIVTIATPTSSGASSSVYTKETDLTSLTLSGTNIIKITGTAVGGTAGSNDITAKFSMGYFFPAAHN